MSSVVLFGGGLQTLSLAKGLKSHNHHIVNIGPAGCVGRYSKFIDVFRHADISVIETDALFKMLKGIDVSVIIPTEDDYAEWLSRNKAEIEAVLNTKCAVEDFEVFSKVIDKSSLMDICRQLGIPHPITQRIEPGRFGDMALEVPFPALIKPDKANGSRGISLVGDIMELEMKFNGIASRYGSCTLQEFIDTPTHYYNAMLFRYDDGTLAPSVVTKITRFYPIKGGSSSFCTTIQNEKIVEICSALLKGLDWHGFADFDVLEKGIGDYRIIEINPRVPASLHAALASGIDFGEIILASSEKRMTEAMTYKPGAQLRFLGLDIAWFLASPERFRTSPSWFKFFGKRLHYQEGGLNDWRAMLYSIYSGIKKQLSPSFRKSKSGMN